MSGEAIKGYPTGPKDKDVNEREYMLFIGGYRWGDRLGKFRIEFDTYRCYPSQQLRDQYGLRVFYTAKRGLYRAVRRAMIKRGF